MHKLLLWCFFIYSCLGKTIEIKCPLVCKCDVFEGLRRATCYDKNLVTLEADIPKEVQILDMSFNQISHLDDHIFWELEYTEIKLLNLSHNKISQIHLNAFRNLKSIKTIDFSHNYIQYLLPHWFWETQSLFELYLNNNNLVTIDNEKIDSHSLKILDISYCHIKEINMDAFKNVPNLESLNLSGNFLTQINANIIKPINNLLILNINNNSLICNNISIELIQYCRKRGIKSTKICDNPSVVTEEKFQRMINLEDTSAEKNAWLHDIEETNNSFIIETVNNCSNCMITTSTDSKTSYKLTFTLIFSSFIIGVLVGFVARHYMKKPKFKRRPQLPRRPLAYRRGRIFNDEYGLIGNVQELSSSTPIPQRKF